MKNCETLHPVLCLFFLSFKMFVNSGREEQCMTSSNMYIYTHLLFYDVL